MSEVKSENTETILDVEGMTCANCAIGVENQLKKHELIRSEKGKHFDPAVVEVFLELII